MNAPDLKAVTDWLVDGAPTAPTPERMVTELFERLVVAGLPLWRAGIFLRALHPDIIGLNLTWAPGLPAKVGEAGFDVGNDPEFTATPLFVVFRDGTEGRCNPSGADFERFPGTANLRAEGVTDYLALPLRFTDGTVNAAGWTTRQAGGFTAAEVDAIRSVMPALSRYVEIMELRRVASMLLDTYVGNRAGELILAGEIHRGHTESMRAAIWLSDLRGFTALSDRLPADTVVDILNRYFDCQVAPIKAQGGEVLKFMGDGLLAVFPIGEGEEDLGHVCARVVAAARQARSNVEAMRYPVGDKVERFRFGLALHVGKVLYGNIGGGNRLDFTCIGPAVNLASRLEKIAGRLGRTVVASKAFAEAGAAGWIELGEFPIAGLAKTERVYGLVDEGPAGAAA